MDSIYGGSLLTEAVGVISILASICCCNVDSMRGGSLLTEVVDVSVFQESCDFERPYRPATLPGVPNGPPWVGEGS